MLFGVRYWAMATSRSGRKKDRSTDSRGSRPSTAMLSVTRGCRSFVELSSAADHHLRKATDDDTAVGRVVADSRGGHEADHHGSGALGNHVGRAHANALVSDPRRGHE